MNQLPDNLTVGAFARAAGVGVETVRFYQRKGLLREPDRPPGGIRRYGQADVTRVRFVKSAQRLGFSLADVAQLLELDDGADCAVAREQAERKLQDVRARLKNLQRVESVLAGLARKCRAAEGQVRCPLIASLQED